MFQFKLIWNIEFFSLQKHYNFVIFLNECNITNVAVISLYWFFKHIFQLLWGPQVFFKLSFKVYFLFKSNFSLMCKWNRAFDHISFEVERHTIQISCFFIMHLQTMSPSSYHVRDSCFKKSLFGIIVSVVWKKSMSVKSSHVIWQVGEGYGKQLPVHAC